LSPCARATDGTWSLNTAGSEFVTGPNTVAACAGDLALDGSPNRDCEQRSVWVDNACPASTVAATGLTARFHRAGKGTIIRSDRRAKVEGRLVDADGRPATGASVCALTRMARAHAPVVVAATATADADGRYRIELPAGASREVFIHHVTGNSVVARHGLTLHSRVRPTLEVRPRDAENGSRLAFRGSLPGPACSQRVVKIQAKVANRWQVFRTDRTNGRCRYSARYRLRATSAGTSYRFRALVPPQAGYPYERGQSNVRTVVGRRNG
jgi:hypothetical protein